MIFLRPSRYTTMSRPANVGMEIAMDSMGGSLGVASVPFMGNKAIAPSVPAPESVSLGSDRMSSQSRHVRAVVSSPRQAVAELESQTMVLGGFVVSSSVSDTGEVGNASMTVRIPREKATEFRAAIDQAVIKISSEDATGYDITDQYTDYQARLTSLERSMQRFERILDEAVEVKDILEVNQAIEQLQRQIDSLNGQMKYTEELSKSTLFALTFSTDELELPLVPEDKWRPETVYRQSVREVIGIYQSIGHSLIKVAVFAAIWIPLLVVVGVVALVLKKLGMRLSGK